MRRIIIVLIAAGMISSACGSAASDKPSEHPKSPPVSQTGYRQICNCPMEPAALPGTSNAPFIPACLPCHHHRHGHTNGVMA